MGNEATSSKLKMGYILSLQDWKVVHKTQKKKIWQNKVTMKLIEEYEYVATDKSQLQNIRNSFEHRFNKPYLVATKYYNEKQIDELCTTFYEASVFLEYIGLRLDEIKDVRYPDCLHLYNACLHGFGQLQAKRGYFGVFDRLVGINQSGQIKIWMNRDFSKQKIEFVGNNHSEFDMLQEVIELVDRRIDVKTQPESIKHFLIQNAKSFQQAVALLRQYSQRYSIQIPSHLENMNYVRLQGQQNAGQFLATGDSRRINSQLNAHSANFGQQHQRYPISSLQAQILKTQHPTNPIAMITRNPHITSVMYQPIEISRNTIYPQYPKQNIIINTNDLKKSQQFAKNEFFENRFNNIKQSQIVSQMFQFPSNLPRKTETHQSSISNLNDNYFRRNNPIFSSHQGSYQFKTSQPYNQYQPFNNTIIYSIQNQVRRDQNEQLVQTLRLQSKKNKLRIEPSIKLTLHNNTIIDSINQPSQHNNKQSAVHVFSININNNSQQYTNIK